MAAGGPVPAPWADVPRVVVDEAALRHPDEAVQALHRAWCERRPVVVALGVDPACFRDPVAHEVDEPWLLDPGYELWHDRLHFLVWANNYDARGGEPIWWWARKAARLGAVEAAGGDRADGDVLLPSDGPAWIDGGPRGGVGPGDVGATVIHAETVERGSLRPVPARRSLGRTAVHLAPDQRAAVDHGAGPARVIAPAGSGKTRVLTARLHHLITEAGYEPDGVVAVAYNRKARDEMVERAGGVGARVLTLNALGYELIAAHLGRRPDVVESREVRRLLEPLVPRVARRLNTDPLAPYLDALGAVRLGLRDPAEVEEAHGDVPGLAEAFPAYRAQLRRRGVIDFDEQILLAIELLLADGWFRREQQARHRHLLVDEMQDLTPAHVLLIRLLASPRLDLFGVGDDDQVIYGHAGASPRFLTEFDRYFPGAGHHALEVNFRCPAPVVAAAGNLLTRNRVRVDKEIRPAPPRAQSADGAGDEALGVVRHETRAGASELVALVLGWLAEEATSPADVAVLVRVGSLLLAPQVALVDAGLPVDSSLRQDVLRRTGVRAALAYLRLAVASRRLDGRDLVEVYRRPSRGLPTWVERWLVRCRSLEDVAVAAARLDDAKVADRLDGLASDLAQLTALAREGTTRAVLEHVRDGVGLGGAVELLDASGGGDRPSHRDDLEALLQVADLHPDPGGFEPWLRSTLATPPTSGGITLSTIHRVKGREWPRVAVFGATEGLLPHRLSTGRAAVEEERRVFHVAITRGIDRVAVLADASRPSPFLAELARPAAPGDVAAAEPEARGVTGARRSAARRAAEEPSADGDLVAALRAWRRERSQADGVPAYVVLQDRHLTALAARRPTSLEELARCPGIGPTRLDAYGEDLLALLRAPSRAPGPGAGDPATAREALPSRP